MIRGVPHEQVLDLKQPYFSKSPIHNFSVFASQLCNLLSVWGLPVFEHRDLGCRKFCYSDCSHAAFRLQSWASI